MGDLNESFRKKLNDVGYQMRKSISPFLEAAQKREEIPLSLNVKETAGFILISWEGALTQMKVMKSLTSLHIFDRAIFDIFLSKGETNGSNQKTFSAPEDKA